jgi:hypothetical protein
MKKRFLQICSLAFVIGFSCLVFSGAAFADNLKDNLAIKPKTANSASKVDKITLIRRNQVTGKVDPQDMLKAQQQANTLVKNKSRSALNLDWIQMGPNNAAGRIRALIFDNRDANYLTLYTGGIAGGIWKSTNLGLTWMQVNTQNNEILRVSSMTQTPSGIIYAGTGETYCATNGIIGTGLYRSDDGENFTLVPGTQPTANDPNSNWAYITKLACSTSGRLYAATNTGLLYSDNGTDWTMAIPGSAIEVEVGSDGTVVAAVNHHVFVAAAGAIENFVDVSMGTATTLPSVKINWIDLAIAPSDVNVIYASLSDSITSKMYGVYVSNDKGVTWRVIFPSNSNYNPLGTNGCYANILAVYPDDPERVLFGGDDMWLGTKYTPTGYFDWQQVSTSFSLPIDPMYVPTSHHNYVFRPNNHQQVVIATDNGISLGTISSTGFSFQEMIKELEIAQFNSLAFSNSKTAVIGGGVNIGTQYIPGGNVLNDPKNGAQIDGNVGGTGEDCAWSMISPTTIVYSILGANPPLTRSEDFGTTPSPTFLGTLPTVIPDYYATTYWESFDYPYSLDTITYYANAGGISAGSTIVVNSSNSKFPLRYVTPDSIAPGDSVKIQDVIQSRYFLGNVKDTSGIFMTKDLLKFSIDPAWFQIATVDGTDPISCLTVSNDLSVLWAGTRGGKLYRVSNLQLADDSVTADVHSSTCIVSTTKIINPLFTDRYVTSVSIAPDNKTILVALGNYNNDNYIYLSTNGLDSLPAFHSVQGNLPAMPVHSGMFEMGSQDRVILGTDFGVFATDNIGAGAPQWEAEATGLGDVPVMKVSQQTNQGTYYHRMENYGIIYCATYGSGIYMDTTYYTYLGTDPGRVNPVAANELNIYPNPSTGNVNISYKLASADNVSVIVYDLTGKTVLSQSFGRRQAGKHTENIELSAIPTGTFLVRLTYSNGNAYGKLMKVK